VAPCSLARASPSSFCAKTGPHGILKQALNPFLRYEKIEWRHEKRTAHQPCEG
jgi:hypothetical protein